jgi:HEAT repeat protein
VRKWVAETLGELPDPRAVPHLIKALADGNDGVRQSVARSLGGLRDPRAITDLVKALADIDKRVRGAAINSLEEIDRGWRRSPQARAAITQLAQALSSWHGDVRESATETLYAIDPEWRHSPQARAAITLLVKARSDRFNEARDSTTEALNEIDPDWMHSPEARAAIPHLVQASLSTDLGIGITDEVRASAARTLRAFGDLQIFSHFIGALASPVSALRIAAVEAVGELGDPQAIPYLIQAFNNFDTDRAAAAAVRALGKLGAAKCVALVVQFLQSTCVILGGTEGAIRGDGRWTNAYVAVEALERIFSHSVRDVSFNDLRLVLKQA